MKSERSDDLPLLAWAPPNVIPFPSVKRTGVIGRAAARAAQARDPEKTIRATVDRTREAHRRKGIPDDVADADAAAFEIAIRCHMARLGAVSM